MGGASLASSILLDVSTFSGSGEENEAALSDMREHYDGGPLNDRGEIVVEQG